MDNACTGTTYKPPTPQVALVGSENTLDVLFVLLFDYMQ